MSEETPSREQILSLIPKTVEDLATKLTDALGFAEYTLVNSTSQELVREEKGKVTWSIPIPSPPGTTTSIIQR